MFSLCWPCIIEVAICVYSNKHIFYPRDICCEATQCTPAICGKMLEYIMCKLTRDKTNLYPSARCQVDPLLISSQDGPIVKGNNFITGYAQTY